MKTRTLILAALAASLAGGVSASWYWPFGSGVEVEDESPHSPTEEAEQAIGACKLVEARTIYNRMRIEFAGAVGEDPAASNVVLVIGRRMREIDEELKRTPPLSEVLGPVVALNRKADVQLEDDEPKKAEELYLDVLTNALPSVVSQNVSRAKTPIFSLACGMQANHAKKRLAEIRRDKRLSELMEPVSIIIDEATDLVNDGKTDEAVEKYREALRALERLELENPERAAQPEFQSVRNKRAYVDAQLNAILLEEARVNAKSVAVTDTTDLEEKLRKKRAADRKETDGKHLTQAEKAVPKLESQLGEFVEKSRARDRELSRAASSAKFERESEEQIRELLEDDPRSRKARILRAGLELHRKNYGGARRELDSLFAQNPNDVSALNLLAAIEAAGGNYRAAEEALKKAIQANKKDYHAYYNMANLIYRRSKGGDADRAKRFYELGRKAGGPENPHLEEVLQ